MKIFKIGPVDCSASAMHSEPTTEYPSSQTQAPSKQCEFAVQAVAHPPLEANPLVDPAFANPVVTPEFPAVVATKRESKHTFYSLTSHSGGSRSSC